MRTVGKTTGFLEYRRRENAEAPEAERIKDYGEFRRGLDEDDRRCQAGRCMDCGVPMCQSAMKLCGMVTGCPLHNLIPEWNDEIYKGHFGHALARLLKTSNFPEFTGRVCPALCEKACINGMDGDPVTVRDNELFLIEKAFSDGLMKPRTPALRSGKKVAVVGSGPAGLAVADQLNRRGHCVTVYEREDRIGGLLMYGIPNMKLDKSVIVRRQKLMEAEGVVFRTGCDVGGGADFAELRKEHDAVVLCCGAKKPRSLNVEGLDRCGEACFAVDYLKASTVALLKGGDAPPGLNARGRNVVIVGGGDTGNDCVATCIRQGCKSVVQLEMTPKPPERRTADNPWPQWPKVLKTDYGQREAAAVFGGDPRIFETTVKELITADGKLKAVRTVMVRFGEHGPEQIPGTEKEIACDLLITAAGFVGCEEYIAEASGVALTKRGTAETAPGGYATSVGGVFCAGDMRRGQSLVVWAVAEGRRCAAEVDGYLMGYTTLT